MDIPQKMPVKQLIKLLLFAFCAIPCQPGYGQIENGQVSGYWLGTLDAGATSLRLAFNISRASEDVFTATMDSPDQGATGIPTGDVMVDGDSIRIEVPYVRGYYLGVFTSAATIQGSWHQSGVSFALDLEKQDSPFVLQRPQEPQPPFPYKEEEVRFKQLKEGFTLAGTLTVPQGQGPFPALVLVSGSGSQNRNEEIFGHKPFWVIADYLTKNGIAVLRYDDRGVGASGGMASGATTADLALDARSAFDYLSTRPEIEQTRLGILGHSEGGLIAFMLAAEYKDIAFIVSLAGPGVDGKTILLEQSDYISRLSGVSESIRKDNRIVMDKVYDLMTTNKTHQSWGDEVIAFTSTYYSSKQRGQYSEEDIERAKRNLLASIPESSYAWMKYFVMSDPAPYFASISCPVLALNGRKDCQVLAEQNINAIKSGLQSAGNKQVTTMILPGLNHLFQTSQTGLPSEYNIIEETFSPNALELISGWVLGLN
jgi:pimeloyl-ACP methyl ester carboxylesterase